MVNKEIKMQRTVVNIQMNNKNSMFQLDTGSGLILIDKQSWKKWKTNFIDDVKYTWITGNELQEMN